MRLKGKFAIVTGGGRGIGLAVARMFAKEGATVMIGDLGHDALRADELFQTLNVTDQHSVEAFVEAALRWSGRIDILVNNAGITRDATLPKMTDEDFDAVVDVNMRGVFRMTRAVAPHMVKQGSGVILNASSVVSGGNFGQTNYAATKAAVEAMTVTWARELAKKGIRVNAVAPGFTDTPMTSVLRQETKDRVAAGTPLGRFATPEEIANAYCFLASDEAKFITGQVLRVDGGYIV